MLGCPERVDSERIDEIGKKIKREVGDAASQTGRRPPGTLNTVTPCAACKLLRRRCSEDCPFFPYFSPHEPQKFAAVHKVFGASNVSKMLMEVPESQRADAANSLVYEANLRLQDPVYGCMGAISALQQQIQSLQAEVSAVRTEILKYKYSRAAAGGGVAAATTTTSNISSSTHPALIVSSGITPTVSIAAPLPSLPPPPQPPPPPSVVVSSSCSSTSSLYTTPTSTTTTGYNSIASDNVAYYD